MKTKHILLAAIMLNVIWGYSQLTATLGPEVQIFPSSGQQSNPTISINKTKPTNLIVSTLEGNFNSLDGGATWGGTNSLPSGLSENISTAFDGNGLGYIASEETSHNVYVLQKSSDRGVTWTSPHGVPETLTNDFSVGFVGVDDMPSSSNANNIYGVWTDSHTFNRFVSSNRSTDNGVTFDNAHVLGSDFGEGAKVQTGPDGEVYICWADHFGFPAAHFPAQNISFFSSADGGINYTPGTGIPYVGINLGSGADPKFGNTIVNDWPSMAVDKSCGSHRGRIYIAYPNNLNMFVYPPGTNESSIAVVYSDNGGTSWSAPILVNEAGTNISTSTHSYQSWMPCISVDDLTGLVAVAYYNIDEEFDGVSLPFLTDTYVAYSTDGTTWQNIKASSTAHNTGTIPGASTGFAGNRIGIASYNGHSYVTWADNRGALGSAWQVYVRRIDYDLPTLTSSPGNLNINSPTVITQNSNYQAGGTIDVSSTGSVEIASGTNVQMTAGEAITMHPGFMADPNSVFLAQIKNVAPCTTINAAAFKTEQGQSESAASITKKSSNGLELFAYPNPTSEFITVGALNIKCEEASFCVTDLSGRTIAKYNNPCTYTGQVRQIIDVSTYPSGVYIVSMETGNEKYYSKFVRQ
ncbi:MAG: type sorting protein [Bacteroidetes bacterium]|nr:type sorting protein [Bacteroidota bacterium]